MEKRFLVEKKAIDLAKLISSINALTKSQTDSVLTFKYVIIDKILNLEHIKFNSTYAKIEIYLDKDEVHLWILDAEREIPDRMIQNAFLK